MSKLCLGSASKWRKELLAQIDIHPDCYASADIDETPHKGENPRVYVTRMAKEKNEALTLDYSDHYLLTADSTVVIGRRILQKPENDAEASTMHKAMSGRTIKVMTAVTLRAPDGRMAERLSLTKMKVKRLSQEELDWYLQTREWEGRAGAFAIQGRFGRFIKSIQGSQSGIVGMPFFETYQMLNGLGYFTSAT